MGGGGAYGRGGVGGMGVGWGRGRGRGICHSCLSSKLESPESEWNRTENVVRRVVEVCVRLKDMLFLSIPEAL